MNTKINPPCRVKIRGKEGVFFLRALSIANHAMISNGWKGLVAHVQNENGAKLVEYRSLIKVDK